MKIDIEVEIHDMLKVKFKGVTPRDETKIQKIISRFVEIFKDNKESD